MFFLVFWTAYIPVTLIILSLVGEWLKRSFREFRAHARVASSPAAREAQSLIEEGRSGGEAIGTTAALAANRH
jgi:hypothetical protein